MNCERADSRLVEYLYEELDDPERQEMEAHLHTCARCTTKLAELRETRSGIAEIEDFEPPPALVEAVLARAHKRDGKTAKAEKAAGGAKVVRLPWWNSQTKAGLALAATAVIAFAAVTGIRSVPPVRKQTTMEGAARPGAASEAGKPTAPSLIRRLGVKPPQGGGAAPVPASRGKAGEEPGEANAAAGNHKEVVAPEAEGGLGGLDQDAGVAREEKREEGPGKTKMLFQIDRQMKVAANEPAAGAAPDASLEAPRPPKQEPAAPLSDEMRAGRVPARPSGPPPAPALSAEQEAAARAAPAPLAAPSPADQALSAAPAPSLGGAEAGPGSTALGRGAGGGSSDKKAEGKVAPEAGNRTKGMTAATAGVAGEKEAVKADQGASMAKTRARSAGGAAAPTPSPSASQAGPAAGGAFAWRAGDEKAAKAEKKDQEKPAAEAQARSNAATAKSAKGAKPLDDAVALAQAGDCKNALVRLDQIASEKPAEAETPGWLKARARCLAESGETGSAIETYERFQKLFPRRAGEVAEALSSLRSGAVPGPAVSPVGK